MLYLYSLIGVLEILAISRIYDNIEVLSSNEVSNQHKKTKYNDTRGGSSVRRRHKSCYLKVETVKGKKCGTKYKIGTSTSNCATHLNNVHGITEEQAKNNLVSLNIPHNELQQLELCQYLVDWIVSDFQPLTILQNKAFRKFITELDSKFQIPNAKHIKKLIHCAYNYLFLLIIKKLKNEAMSRLKPASLTNEINIEKIQDIFIAIDENTNQQKGTNLDKLIQSSNAIEKVKEPLYHAMCSRIIENKYHKMKNNLTVNSTTASKIMASSQNLSDTTSSHSTITTLYKPTLFNIFNNLLTINSQYEFNEYLAVSQIPFSSDPF
ncbi:42412_t:CDS:2, partial [Gigaspora margarita]